MQRLSSRQLRTARAVWPTDVTASDAVGYSHRTHTTSRPTGYGVRYIGPYGDSFIFHFFSPDLAAVPDLGLLTPSRQGSGSLAGSGHARSSYETSLSISLRLAARPRRGPQLPTI